MRTMTEPLTAPDGTRLHSTAWLPDTEPKAILLIVHGLAEHSGRYAHVADYFVKRGYAVFAVDYHAHGRSDGRPRATFASFDLPISAIKTLVDRAKAQYPALQVFILGHSLGTLVTLLFALKYPDAARGLVLTATMLDVANTPAPLAAIVGALDKVAPDLPFLKLQASKISRDEAVRRAYDHDPLNYRGRLRVHIVREMIAQAKAVLEQVRMLRLPLLILHGEDDALVAMRGSQMLYERAGSPDKTFKIYPGLYHEILNEPEREQVMDDIADWLDAHQ